MYHLQVSPKKSFTYIARTDSIFATINDKKVDEFTHEQRGSQLLKLAQKRQSVRRGERCLYTAFMMRFAEPFKSYAVGIDSIRQSKQGTNEDKDTVGKVLDDVFRNGVKVPKLFDRG